MWDTTGDDCEGASPVVFPEDPDEKIDLIFSISLNEFTKLLSSVEKGATLSYPVEDWQVVWTFLRAFECPMQICEAIINCLMTDPDTREAIVNMLLNNDEFIDGIRDIAGGRQPINPGEIVKPIVEDCDKDVLFGAITRVVDGMNTNNIDAFEIMEEATNDEERAVLLIEAVPILAEFVPAELVDIAQQLVENMQENYDAEWTAALRDKIRMDLLCIAERECKLTVGMIYDYFAGRIGSTLNIATGFLDAARFLAYGDFPGERIVDFAMMFQAVALRGGSAFFGQTLYSVELQAALGANNPDNDWSLLEASDCPDDETECYEVVYHASPTTWDALEGENSGVSVRKDQLIQITASGTIYPYGDSTPVGPNGGGAGDSGNQLPSAPHLSFIAKVGPDGQWHEIGEEGEFTAENDGYVYMNVNEQAIASHYYDNTGTLDVEICIPPLPIVLQKTADAYLLELVSENDGEPIYEVETIATGHAGVFMSIEIHSTQFYIKHVQLVNPESEYASQLTQYGTIGLGVGNIDTWWKPSNIPADKASTVLGMQGVGPGLQLRFTLTTTPGETGELVPYTIGALP